MTKEEASIIIGNLIIIPDDCYSVAEYQEAKAIAIKALEQEPILDKIRAEIEEYRDTMPWESESLVKWEAINYILEQIIDKYKAGCEE